MKKKRKLKLRTLDQQIIAVIAVFLLVSVILVMPSNPFRLLRLSVIDTEEPLIGSVTKGDFTILYSMFAATISVILFVWAWVVYRKRH